MTDQAELQHVDRLGAKLLRDFEGSIDTFIRDHIERLILTERSAARAEGYRSAETLITQTVLAHTGDLAVLQVARLTETIQSIEARLSALRTAATHAAHILNMSHDTCDEARKVFVAIEASR